MRVSLLIAFVLLASATAGSAQELARVQVTATLHIPDFMKIERSRFEDSTRADGSRVQRVTLLITANRRWRLEVSPMRDDVSFAVSKASGRAGQREEVVVELVWDARAPAPDPDDVAYTLLGA